MSHKFGKLIASKDGYSVRERCIFDKNGNRIRVEFVVIDPAGDEVDSYNTKEAALQKLDALTNPGPDSGPTSPPQRSGPSP